MPDIFTNGDRPAQPQQPVAPQPVQPAQPQPVPQVGTTEQPAIQVTASPERKSVGLFSSFRMHPKGIKFVNQENDEFIILFIRRHFIINVPWIAITILLILLPPFMYALITLSNLSLFTIPPDLIIIMIAFYYLIVANYALMNFIIWFYHVGIVTPKRLLDLDVYNILSHHLAETELADVVDVSYAQKGFFQSFFNYGDVPIQTQAIKANFEFEASPHPAEVSDIITDLRPHRPHQPKPGGNRHA